MALKPLTLLRSSAIAVAVFVGGHALWHSTVDLIRPPQPLFAAANTKASTVDKDIRAAGSAAMLGYLRSDLWTDYAVALAAPLDSKNKSAEGDVYRGVESAAERAIVLGPHDARSWLLLANVHSQLDGLNRTIIGPLKMSYYTGPNETSLMPTRLSLATATDVITDPEIRELATNDLRTILLHRFELKPAILAAYRSASPDGKRFVEAEVSLLDPGFAGQLQAATAPQ